MVLSFTVNAVATLKKEAVFEVLGMLENLRNMANAPEGGKFLM